MSRVLRKSVFQGQQKEGITINLDELLRSGAPLPPMAGGATSFNDNGYPVEIQVPIDGIQNGTIASGPLLITGTSVTCQMTDSGTGVPVNTITIGAQTARIQFCLPGHVLQTVPKNAAPLGSSVSGLFGFKVTDVCLQYRINTASSTSSTFSAGTVLQVDAAAPVTTLTSYGGTWTFAEPPVQPAVVGTGALGLTFSANIYNIQCIPASANAPFFHQDMGRLEFLWGIVGAATETVDVFGIQIHGIWAILG